MESEPNPETVESFRERIMRESIEPGLISPVGGTQTPLACAEVCATASCLDYTVARSIYFYGKTVQVRIYPWLKLRYFYNGINPGLKYQAPLDPCETDAHGEPPDKTIFWDAWLGRYPWLLAHMQFSGWLKPNPVQRAAWCAKLLQCAVRRNPEDLLLGYYLVTPDDAWKGIVRRGFIAFWKHRTKRR